MTLYLTVFALKSASLCDLLNLSSNKLKVLPQKVEKYMKIDEIYLNRICGSNQKINKNPNKQWYRMRHDSHGEALYIISNTRMLDIYDKMKREYCIE